MMRGTLSLVAMLAACGIVVADAESGPKAGEKIPELKVYAVAGPITDKEVDYAAERKDELTVYYFVNTTTLSRPAFRVMRTVDMELSGLDAKAAGVAVMVGGEADKNKQLLTRVQTAMNFDKTALTVFDGDASGPNGWGINSDAQFTVVIAKGGKVVKSLGYSSVDVKDGDAILKELKAIKEKK